MKIIPYQERYEKTWVYCKGLAYLFSDFFDDISRYKDGLDYFEDKIELIALEGETVIGLLDIGIYDKESSQNYPYVQADKVAYFANLAVHPDYQNKGIAARLFEEAEALLRQKKVDVLAIFTRGDANANHLYHKWGAKLICRDWLVQGLPKTEKQSFQFCVSLDDKRLVFKTDDGEFPYYQREGLYIVSKEEHLSDFDACAIYEERTYLKWYS